MCHIFVIPRGLRGHSLLRHRLHFTCKTDVSQRFVVLSRISMVFLVQFITPKTHFKLYYLMCSNAHQWCGLCHKIIFFFCSSDFFFLLLVLSRLFFFSPKTDFLNSNLMSNARATALSGPEYMANFSPASETNLRTSTSMQG